MYDLSMVHRHVERVRRSPDAVSRDARHNEVRMARANNYHLLNPDAFSEDWPKPIIANFLEQAGRDMAESLAPLPSLTCASGSMVSEAAKDRGSRRTKIGNWYWQHSRLKRHSVNAADWFFTMGFLPIVVEPDLEGRCPRIRFEDPYLSYPEMDRYGSVVTYSKVMRLPASRLAVLFPDRAHMLTTDCHGRDRSDVELEVVRFSDKHCTVMYVCDQDKFQKSQYIDLAFAEHGLSRCPVAVSVRSSLDGEMRGQYDDAIWVQLARAKMASLALEAGVKAVEAPIAVPNDMVNLPIGPDAIWRTEQPQNIRRVALEVPSSAFAMDQRLNEEAMRSTRYPEARGGNISASVITGRGVQELMGSFDALIKTAQDAFGEGLREATSIAFEMDDKMFGSVEKKISGISAGAPYEIKYKPSKDIAGDYSCEVTYGLAAGLAPNNAVVLMLQLLGAGLISKESVQKQLPFDVDPIEMSQAITLERGREAILAGVSSYAQSLPAMAAQGMDPVLPLQQISKFLDAVRKGRSMEDAAAEAFTPPEPSPEELAAEEAAAAAAGGPMGGGMGGPGPLGDQGPQALPDIASMVASFRGGKADMSASVKRNQLL